MIVTEEEAKTKFCPMMRDRVGDVEAHKNCIASACMMYIRWNMDHEDERGFCGLARKWTNS